MQQTKLTLRSITPEDVTAEGNRQYDLGRKHGKEELAETIANYRKLYGLVEAYLCTPNTTPAVKDAYDSLVEWFTCNRTPEGNDPKQVAKDT